MQYLEAIVLCVIAVATLLIAAVLTVHLVLSRRKSAKIEGKVSAESKRLVWRVVNTGARSITIVEIGMRCADKNAAYRPLFASDDVSNLPVTLSSGEIASYRKEMERFAFKQSETDALKVTNPAVYFYAKDAEGKIYTTKSEYNFVQYLTILIGGGK